MEVECLDFRATVPSVIPSRRYRERYYLSSDSDDSEIAGKTIFSFCRAIFPSIFVFHPLIISATLRKIALGFSWPRSFGKRNSISRSTVTQLAQYSHSGCADESLCPLVGY